MQLFKPKTNEVVVNDNKPLPVRIEAARRIMKWFPIGSRIRYYPELEEKGMMDSLIMGYVVDKIPVFRQADISIADTSTSPVLRVIDETGEVRVKDRYEDFYLVIPASSGEELKLDYDTRASMGQQGHFGKYTKLTLLTQNGNQGNISIEAEVHRNVELKKGVHAGHKVALLSVLLGTVEAYEPRAQIRIATRLPVTVSKNGSETVLSAVMLDVSESALRLVLEDDRQAWPEFGSKDFVIVGLKADRESPMQRFKCRPIRTAGNERVFAIEQVHRQGRYEPFSTLDAMELKIHFLNQQP